MPALTRETELSHLMLSERAAMIVAMEVVTLPEIGRPAGAAANAHIDRIQHTVHPKLVVRNGIIGVAKGDIDSQQRCGCYDCQ